MSVSIVLSDNPKDIAPERHDLFVGFDVEDLRRMLTRAVDLKCSDVKIQSGDYITVYYKRKWYAFSTRILDDADAKKALRMLDGDATVTQILGGKEIDSNPEFFREDENGKITREFIRFRLNAVLCRVGGFAAGVSITLRSIPDELPELAYQGLPDGLAEDLMPVRGTVLVSGATGSGKTTLIAALLNERLKETPAPCILTHEDPTEFSYGRVGLGRGPLVSQINIYKHIKDWSRAGPTAMRRKGDIILMGEVRDTVTAEATTEMGITGHCVYGTIHADTPNETIFRLVEMFPEGARSAAAAKMLGSLRAICSQKIITGTTGRIFALRSWIIFDSKIKDDLQSPEWPYPRWSAYVRDYLKSHGLDFASQCIPWIRAGEIEVKLFREITQMGRDEAAEYVAAALHNNVEAA
jgi:defect-in-organelle-trafficking protein DotB